MASKILKQFPWQTNSPSKCKKIQALQSMHSVNFYFHKIGEKSRFNQACVHKKNKPRPNTSLCLFLQSRKKDLRFQWRSRTIYWEIEIEIRIAKLRNQYTRSFQRQGIRRRLPVPTPACARDVYTYIEKNASCKVQPFHKLKKWPPHDKRGCWKHNRYWSINFSKDKLQETKTHFHAIKILEN